MGDDDDGNDGDDDEAGQVINLDREKRAGSWSQECIPSEYSTKCKIFA